MNRLTNFLIFIGLLQLTYACYITNCPIGGKRNVFYDQKLRHHQCPTCGINGQCFGPSICCTSLGCRMGHPSDVRQCSAENHSPEPCSIKSSICLRVPNGRCAANGVCCNTESCQMDEICSMSSSQDNDHSNEERLSRAKLLLL